jgi:hypothetical protein
LVIELSVPKKDMGKIIDKQGRKDRERIPNHFERCQW